MKKTSLRITLILLAGAALGLSAITGTAQESQPLSSLRSGSVGDSAVDTSAIENYRLMPDGISIKRDFILQPPLIPHKAEGYQINLRLNQCLSCHSFDNYKRERAPSISVSHYKDRAGNQLSALAPERYFCTQCHVPQTDAKALVGNTYSADGK